MRTSDSTLAVISRFEQLERRSPTIEDLNRVVPPRLQRLLEARVAALIRGGHVTVDDFGRITRATGTTPTETL